MDRKTKKCSTKDKKCDILTIQGGDSIRPSELFVEVTGQTGLFNIQAIDNIPSIMRHGLLSNEGAKRIAHTSIAMQEVQDRRDVKTVPNGLALHKYANLYFDPRNPMLSARRNQNQDLCILKIDASILDFRGVVVSDRNASSSYASFYPPVIGIRNIDFNLVYATWWKDDDYYVEMKKKSIKCAEVLVPHEVPYNFIVCAAVVSEQAKHKLEAIGFDKEIVVKPGLFF